METLKKGLIKVSDHFSTRKLASKESAISVGICHFQPAPLITLPSLINHVDLYSQLGDPRACDAKVGSFQQCARRSDRVIERAALRGGAEQPL